jgi:pimeloyl-ACP methyl ester carboxylesterase
MKTRDTDSLADFCAPGASWFDRMVPLPTGVSLRIVSFTPPSKSQPLPLVMIPGLVSVMPTFQRLLVEFTRDFDVHYIETREKASSTAGKNADFRVETIGRDIIEAISHLGLEDRKYILLGTSLSATAMVDRYPDFRRVPFCMVLLEPNAVFDYPPWSLPLIRRAAGVYGLIRPVVKWYLRNFRVNTDEDAEMYQINCRALDRADPYKLRDAVLAISAYKIWDRLESVRTPTLIVSASKDTFHRHGDIQRMISMIKPGTHCDLESHRRIHSAEFADRVRDYVRTLSAAGTRFEP